MHDLPTNDTIEQIITNLSDSMNTPSNILYHFDSNADNQFSKHNNIDYCFSMYDDSLRNCVHDYLSKYKGEINDR